MSAPEKERCRKCRDGSRPGFHRDGTPCKWCVEGWYTPTERATSEERPVKVVRRGERKDRAAGGCRR